MDNLKILREALTTDSNALALHTILKKLIENGASRQALLSDLESIRAELRLSGNEVAEDIALEAMDFLVGWCPPSLCL